jgi:hypothetical protein
MTEDQAMIDPAGDPEALRGAIKVVFDDPGFRRSYEENGYRCAMSLGGEKQLYENLLDVLRG